MKIQEIIENYMSRSKKIHDEYNKKNPLKSNLYHYTDFKGLKGILETREIWFTHYRYLNDPTEIIFAKRIVEETLDQYIKESILEIFWKNFKNIYPSHIDHCTIYVFSLCQESDYLPAWRWYGDNGAGFSIGFKSSYFEPKEIYNENPVVSLKINYNIENFTSLIKQFLQLTNKMYLENIHLIPSSCRDDSNVQFGGALAASLLPLMPGLKHEGYLHEKEHRLYQFEFVSNGKIFPYEIPSTHKFNDTKLPKPAHLNPCANPSSSIEIPRLKSEKFNYNDICEIWVGPCCDFECAQREIINILNSSGYEACKIEIKKSEQPYRS